MQSVERKYPIVLKNLIPMSFQIGFASLDKYLSGMIYEKRVRFTVIKLIGQDSNLVDKCGVR